MPRIQPIDPAVAEGKAKALLDDVHKALGMTPNIMRTMASSPVVLDAYVGFGKALSGGTLRAPLRELIALAVAGANGCEYCAAAHTALGKMHGLQSPELAANLEGRASEPAVAAALDFALAIVDKCGWVDDADLARVRTAGYGEGEIAEILATVALNIFSTYFNHVAETEVDFPPVALGARAAA